MLVRTFAFAAGIALFLGACATDPAARCAPAERRELATIDRLIADIRAEVARGYRTVRTETNPAINLCLGGLRSNVGVSFCTDPGVRTHTEAIDPEAAARTLDALLARREALQARIDAAVATCPAK